MEVEKRGRGRPAYGSREKLVVAAAALISERGFEATSPTMVLKRSGVGHGSLYHYFEGKEALALAAIEFLRTRAVKILGLPPDPESTAVGAITRSDVDAALDRLFAAKEGRALLRLLTDPTAAASIALSTAVQTWCAEIRVAIYLTVDVTAAAMMKHGQSPWQSVEAMETRTEPFLTAALGRGLLRLPRQEMMLGSAQPR